jgi:hypothetical protein
MRALYSLVCHLRTVCAMAQGVLTLTFDGWAALTAAQFLVLGCGLCIVLRILVPSPSASAARPLILASHLLSTVTAVSVVGLGIGSLAGAGVFIASCLAGA